MMRTQIYQYLRDLETADRSLGATYLGLKCQIYHRKRILAEHI
jgi:hypothetical protein